MDIETSKSVEAGFYDVDDKHVSLTVDRDPTEGKVVLTIHQKGTVSVSVLPKEDWEAFVKETS